MSQYNQPPVGVPPPQGYPPEGYPKESYQPQGYPQQGYPPPYAPQYSQQQQQQNSPGCLEAWMNMLASNIEPLLFRCSLLLLSLGFLLLLIGVSAQICWFNCKRVFGNTRTFVGSVNGH
ncbi:BnaC03g23330D [Brassica napus]|nr:unnamed protein product [Brassica napus]CDY22523.1 BnaC03g23330D [Brassica napus]